MPSTGNHKLNIWMREDGVIIDRILVTPSGSYVPSGNGPAESATTTTTSTSSYQWPTLDWYGNGWAAASLWNIYVGGISSSGTRLGRRVSQRFKALHTGRIVAFTWFNIANTNGYAAGTGGDIKMSFQANDPTVSVSNTTAGAPNGIYIGGSSNYAFLNDAMGKRFDQRAVMPTPVSVVAGQTYHLVYENVDPYPHLNYTSVDNLRAADGVFHPDPQIPENDWEVIFRDTLVSGSGWRASSTLGTTPSLTIEYEDGFVQGSPYMEVWLSGNSHHHNGDITTSQFARQTFTPQTTFSASHLSLYMKRVSGTGSLRIEIGRVGGGVMQTISVPYSQVPTSVAWIATSFASQTFNAGTLYYIALKGASSTVYDIYPTRDGSIGYQWHPGAAIKGRAEYSTNTGSTWVGWKAWDKLDRSDGDLMFYFAP